MKNRNDRPVWITGAAGLIGSAIANAATTYAPEFRALGLTRKDVDLTDFAAVRALFLRHQPSLVIHCAALSASPLCQADPALARKINVEATAHLAELAAGIEFVGGEAEAGEDGEEDEAVPDLELPADGFGDFHVSME